MGSLPDIPGPAGVSRDYNSRSQMKFQNYSIDEVQTPLEGRQNPISNSQGLPSCTRKSCRYANLQIEIVKVLSGINKEQSLLVYDGASTIKASICKGSGRANPQLSPGDVLTLREVRFGVESQTISCNVVQTKLQIRLTRRLL